MQQDAVDIASKALSEYNIEKVREGTNNEISGENVNHLFSPSILWLPAEL
jgi:hypothetical protein